MANNTKLEVYQDKKGDWRWRRTATNGQIVGSATQGYSSKGDAEKNANRDGGKDTWVFYKDKQGQHRWRATATNGQIVGSATQGYSKKSDAEDNARTNGWKG